MIKRLMWVLFALFFLLVVGRVCYVEGMKSVRFDQERATKKIQECHAILIGGI